MQAIPVPTIRTTPAAAREGAGMGGQGVPGDAHLLCAELSRAIRRSELVAGSLGRRQWW